MKIKIAVISDIHGHADGLRVALQAIETQGVDLTVCLGDLLTYGTQPNAVIDTLLSYQMRQPFVLLKGNHDQFYFDWQRHQLALYAMPDFVKESIEWTTRHLDYAAFEHLFDWREHFVFEQVYFAHANPFAYGDWRYLDKPESCEAAILALKQHPVSLGVFGHSHRQSLRLHTTQGLETFDACMQVDTQADEMALMNPGTVGQPRGCGFCYGLLTIEAQQVQAQLIPLQVDTAPMILSLQQSDLSPSTQQKLIGYLRS